MEQEILSSIREIEVGGAQRTVASNYPDTPSTWVSVYQDDATTRDDEPDKETPLQRAFTELVGANSFNESACRKTAEIVLQGMVDRFMEEFHDRERIPFNQRITEGTGDTLKSELEDLLSLNGKQYQRRVKSLREDHRGEYEEKRKSMGARFRDHIDLCQSVTDAMSQLGGVLETAGEGIAVDMTEVVKTWQQVAERYEQDESTKS